MPISWINEGQYIPINLISLCVGNCEYHSIIFCPSFTFLHAAFRCGCENMVAFTRYGDQMRRQRKLLQRALGSTTISKYHPLLEVETAWFLKRLLEDPEDYVSPVRRYAGGMTLLVMYGYQAKPNGDPFLSRADHCVDLLANEITSGGGIWPVDVFPACMFNFWRSRDHISAHLPTWFLCTSATFTGMGARCWVPEEGQDLARTDGGVRG